MSTGLETPVSRHDTADHGGGKSTALRLASAIERGGAFLIGQAAQGFTEARHVMKFPRWAGFTAEQEQQSSDAFVRAVIGSLLAEIADLSGAAETAATFRQLASREAGYIAYARLHDCAGGWSYFPGLPELPPDADSLAASLTLFTRAAPQQAAICEVPVGLALQSQIDDGSIETWITADGDVPARRQSMLRGIANYWGHDRSVDVGARFFRALHGWDAKRFAQPVSRGAEFIRSRQSADGSWSGEWYSGFCYATLLAVDFLRAVNDPSDAVARAETFVRETQRSDGGWGAALQSVALDTACALWILAGADREHHREPIARGLSFLLDGQSDSGFWKASPWIKMDVGRAQGQVLRTLTHGNRVVTTALCLRTLLLLRHANPAHIAQGRHRYKP